jgi:hypothetical protein
MFYELSERLQFKAAIPRRSLTLAEWQQINVIYMLGVVTTVANVVTQRGRLEQATYSPPVPVGRPR